MPLHLRLLFVGLLGAGGAAWVGYETAKNPSAAPAHVAVTLRVVIILALVLSGLFAYGSRSQRPMGRLLIIAGLFSCVWLLNGSREQLDYTLGLAASSLAPGLFCYLILAFPSGHIESRAERRFLTTTTVLMVFAWMVGVFSHRQPIVDTPLLLGAQRGLNSLYLGLPDVHDVLGTVVRADWLVLIAGTALLLARRTIRGNRYSRLLLVPMVTIAVVQVCLFAAFAAHSLAGSPKAGVIGAAYVATVTALPIAIFLGLAMQRLSLGRVLASFVTALGSRSAVDVQSAMASTLNDPELKIFYRRNDATTMVDAGGEQLSRRVREGRRRTRVRSRGRTLAVVDFDASMRDQEEYIQATGKSAVLWLEKERLATELATSKRILQASRARLARTADEERLRIQRDLHDGAQQHLIGMHVKLELALETIQEAPAHCAALLAEIGNEVGQTASDLRSLAADVFPPTLREHGLIDALRSAIHRMGIDVRLEAHGVNRHPGEVETQLYFVCLEALQNIFKHGGPGVTATLRMWEVKRWFYLELRDTGVGFDSERVMPGSGLSNMQERLYSIGGRLTVISRDGAGTLVRAVAPIRRPTSTRPDRYSTRSPRATSEARSP